MVQFEQVPLHPGEGREPVTLSFGLLLAGGSWGGGGGGGGHVCELGEKVLLLSPASSTGSKLHP
jgi:hypothetical protein